MLGRPVKGDGEEVSAQGLELCQAISVSRFAVAQPNAILEAGNAENASLAVIEAPLPQDDTHVLITGIDPEADLVQEALARIVTAYPASVP